MYFASPHLQDEKIEVPHTWALVLSIQVMDWVGLLDHFDRALSVVFLLLAFSKRIWKGLSTQKTMVGSTLHLVFLSHSQNMAWSITARPVCHR